MKEADKQNDNLQREVIEIAKLPDFNNPDDKLRLVRVIEQLDQLMYKNYFEAIKLTNILLLSIYENTSVIKHTVKAYKNLFAFYENYESKSNEDMQPNAWKFVGQHAYLINQAEFLIANHGLDSSYKDFVLGSIHSSEVLYQYIMYNYRPTVPHGTEIFSMVNFIKITQQKLLKYYSIIESEEKIMWPKKNFKTSTVSYIPISLDILVANNKKKIEIIEVRKKSALFEETHFSVAQEIEELLKQGDKAQKAFQLQFAHDYYVDASKKAEEVQFDKYILVIAEKVAVNTVKFVETTEQLKIGKELKNTNKESQNYHQFMVEQLNIILKCGRVFVHLSNQDQYYLDNIFDEKLKANIQYSQYISFVNLDVAITLYNKYLNRSVAFLEDQIFIFNSIIELCNICSAICKVLQKDGAQAIRNIQDEELSKDIERTLNEFYPSNEKRLGIYQHKLEELCLAIEERNIKKEKEEKEFQQKLEDSERIYNQLMKECLENEQKASKKSIFRIERKSEIKAYTKPLGESLSSKNKIPKSQVQSKSEELIERALELMSKKDYKKAEALYHKLLKDAGNYKKPIFLSAIADCNMYYALADLKKLHTLEYKQFSVINRNLHRAIDYHEQAINWVEEHMRGKDVEVFLNPINLALDFIYSLNKNYTSFLENRKLLLIAGKEKAKAAIIEKFGWDAWYHNDPNKPKSEYIQELEYSTQRLTEALIYEKKIQIIKDKNGSLLTKFLPQNSTNSSNNNEDCRPSESLKNRVKGITEKPKQSTETLLNINEKNKLHVETKNWVKIVKGEFKQNTATLSNQNENNRSEEAKKNKAENIAESLKQDPGTLSNNIENNQLPQELNIIKKDNINRIRSNTLPTRDNITPLPFSMREYERQSTINPRIAAFIRGV